MKLDFQVRPASWTRTVWQVWSTCLLWIITGLVWSPISAFAQQLDDNNPYDLQASFQVREGTDEGLMTIVVKLADGWYIYSSTQPPGGPLKSKVSLLGEGVSLAGTLAPDHAPKEVTGELGFENIVIEKHFDGVTWTVPLKFAKTTGNDSLKFEAKFAGQVCSNACIPLNKKLPVAFAGMLPGNPNASSGRPGNPSLADQPSTTLNAGSVKPLPDARGKPATFRDDKGHVTWAIGVVAANPANGSSATLRVIGRPDPGYHLYINEPQAKETPFRTWIILDQKGSLQVKPPATSSKVVESTIGTDTFRYHEGEVAWDIPLNILANAKTGESNISGLVGYQACTDSMCDPPLAFRFTLPLEITDRLTAKGNSQIEAVSFSKVAKSEVRLTWFDPATSSTNENPGNANENPSVAPPPGQESPPAPSSRFETPGFDVDLEEPIFDLTSETPQQQSLLIFFVSALIGGFFLNFMPCVLPVIGLKVMSFMQEGEGSTRRFVMLNLFYVLGILAVTMSLGILTVLAKNSGETLSWGQHFGDPRFRLGVLILIFSMALSFLGVWEIPIPGFATSKASGQLMKQEGPLGAFFKGALTTLLATPCTGPFLGTALSVTLTQSNTVILTVFFLIGLGLGLPYLAIAAYPDARKWIPKPGAWMDILKQMLAFPLLFTTIFLLSMFPNDYRIAAATTLIAVWMGCWIIGQVPAYYPLLSRLAGWSGGILVASMIGYWSFQNLGPVDASSDHHIAWEPYSESRLRELKKAGRTVLIDFTASWCVNCKTNLKFAIETQKVAQQIRKNQVVALVADLSDTTSPEGEAIQAKLDSLQCNGIPVLAVYSPKAPDRPYVLRALLPESTVLQALELAGPSKE